jgi:hypothetical protein
MIMNALTQNAPTSESRPRQVFHVTMGGPENTDQIITNHIIPLYPTTGLLINNEWITQQNFPITPTAQERDDEIEVFGPGFRFDESEGLRLLEDRGLTPPTCEHALRFVMQYAAPAIFERKTTIIFLHEPWLAPDGQHRFMCFRCGPTENPVLAVVCLKEKGKCDERFVLAGVRRERFPMVSKA